MPGAAHRVIVRRDLPVPMRDGVTLLADRYIPAGVVRPPTILIRSPYGRRGAIGLAYGWAFARRGFQVVLQSCRGTFGSGGEPDPLDEHEDGMATVEWLRSRPWYGGRFAMHGPSYLGYTQWAVAPYARDLAAMAVQVAASQFRDAAYVGGSFALESSLIWTTLAAGLGGPLGRARALLAPHRTRRAVRTGRPVSELDLLCAGRPLPFFRQLLTHHADPSAPYWRKRDFSPHVGEVEAAVTMLAGWYDVFLPWQIKDYLALRAAGRRPYLTIGPWYHLDVRHWPVAHAEAVAWFRAHLLGDASGLRANPVRLYVTGAGEWQDHPDWPVPGMRPARWHLQPGFALAEANPADSAPDRFRYDPRSPTPVIGGPVLVGNSEPRDNRPLEARPDVLVYTSPALGADVEAIGPVTAEVFVRPSREHADVVVRVCDVHPDGRSLNVCEGVRRLAPGVAPPDADGVRRVQVELWPIGHRFRRGHRIRVHVAGGAYPRIARNTGTGEPLLRDGGAMVPTELEVFHDPRRPSAVILPVVPR
ncbi:peptidase S15 [Thermopolyspora flexuosa]|uniref:Xaa-Pro dipeptidyl-peptidase C-terminal domain-containing protein n=1 Tax=Thermopolyspora flexuosa TaxID=103836 RepID=A0A543IYF3_9ACTN|nr:CocE/NonD family hydrolase [Thermopolyspora flexuosa]TQM75609.1 hypothetical protein FHX40_2321 [Thermopolyspora flexuosa]GGM60714.1 peptidase S15 [Thermopolyspora flexuosa]